MSTNLGVLPGTGDYAVFGPCSTCGFRPDLVPPAAAARRLRELPAQWRRVLAVHLDDDDPEAALIGRAESGHWTALEHAGHVRDVLHALDIRIQRVLREDDPVLPETHLTPPSGANEQGMAVVLAALGLSADQLAQTIEQTPDMAWSRTGRRAHRTVRALDLVREALHEATHHLDEAESSIRRLRSTPAGRV